MKSCKGTINSNCFPIHAQVQWVQAEHETRDAKRAQMGCFRGSGGIGAHNIRLPSNPCTHVTSSDLIKIDGNPTCGSSQVCMIHLKSCVGAMHVIVKGSKYKRV